MKVRKHTKSHMGGFFEMPQLHMTPSWLAEKGRWLVKHQIAIDIFMGYSKWVGFIRGLFPWESPTFRITRRSPHIQIDEKIDDFCWVSLIYMESLIYIDTDDIVLKRFNIPTQTHDIVVGSSFHCNWSAAKKTPVTRWFVPLPIGSMVLEYLPTVTIIYPKNHPGL